MSTSVTPPLEDKSRTATDLEIKIVDKIKALETRFEKLKTETESLLNKMAEDGQKLQGETTKLAEQVLELTKKLNLAIDEIRSIGGKKLEKTDTAPVEKIRKGLGITMFDFFDDEEEEEKK